MEIIGVDYGSGNDMTGMCKIDLETGRVLKIDTTNDPRRARRWQHQYENQFRTRPSRGYAKHIRRQKAAT